MSLHTKTLLVIAAILNFAVCAMAFASVEQGTLPTFAVGLIPYTLLAWFSCPVSYALDLFSRA